MKKKNPRFERSYEKILLEAIFGSFITRHRNRIMPLLLELNKSLQSNDIPNYMADNNIDDEQPNNSVKPTDPASGPAAYARR